MCCYCGTGCGVRVRVSQGAVLAVRGDDSHPANHGRLCSKGLALADTVRADHARVLAVLRAGRTSRASRSAGPGVDIAADRRPTPSSGTGRILLGSTCPASC